MAAMTGIPDAVASVFGGNPQANLGLVDGQLAELDPVERRKKLMAAAGAPVPELDGRTISDAVLGVLK